MCFIRAFLLFALVVLGAQVQHVQADIPASELSALQSIYESTSGPLWLKSQGWFNSLDPCAWYGIVCASPPSGVGQVVIGIALYSNGLVGQWPSVTLPYLRALSLSNNPDLAGVLPDLSSLVSLEQLVVIKTGLTGPLPTLPPSINFIDTTNTPFSGAFPSFDNNTQLTSITMSGNQLVGAIPDLSSLTRLNHLQLTANKLTSMPSFVNNPSLLYLDVSENAIQGELSSSFFPSSLQYINLASNQFSGALPDLSHLPRLMEVHVTQNTLNGTIPSFSNNPRLTQLELGWNQFAGVTPSFVNNTMLSQLVIDCNSLSAPLPTIATTTSLEWTCYDGKTTNQIIPCPTWCKIE